MNGIKPIKRNLHLQPLSRDHHLSLLFIWKIRQGLRNGAIPEEMSAYTVWFWHQHIKKHFELEEKTLLPLLSGTHPLSLRMKDEHKQIRELVHALEKKPSREDFIRLTDLVESHIRFEEREFFNCLEKQYTNEELSQLELREEKGEPISKEWENEFWLPSSKDKMGK